MKIISFTLITLFLSLFAQTTYAATCTAEQKATMARLNLSIEEINKNCTGTMTNDIDNRKSSFTRGYAADEEFKLRKQEIERKNKLQLLKELFTEDDAGNFTITPGGQADVDRGKRDANTAAQPEKSFQNADFFKPEAEKVFVYAGLRTAHSKPYAHETTHLDIEFSIAYFLNSTKPNSFGVGLTQSIQGGKFKDEDMSTSLNSTWYMGTISVRLLYVLSRGRLFSTIPFVGVGNGLYVLETETKDASTTTRINGRFRKTSAGVQLISNSIYTSGEGFYSAISYDAYSNIDLDNSSQELDVSNALNLSLGYMW